MKAVRLTELGGPDKLHVETVADPQPGPGQVCIKITRAAFNRRDVFITQGLYPAIELPRTLGSDGTGTVAALGTDVRDIAVGSAVVIDPQIGWSDRTFHASKGMSILGMPLDGTFAEYVTVPAENVYARPLPLSDDEAAAIPLAGLTAYRAVFTRGHIVKDDIVLITGVGGGVQTFVLLFAKHAGARTVVTSSSDAKLERARQMGADVTINSKTSAAWHKEVRSASDGGPTLVVDSSGGETLAKCLEVARPGARVVIYGGTGGDTTIRPYSIFWKHLDVLGTSMGSPTDFRGMLALFAAGLRPVIDRVYRMEQCAEAAQRLLIAEQFGKIVLAIA
ncbi:MAG: NAD(P)-dependent alcohol dehydrogenase [Candidatus Eremiobacteraeota bacterium]|nr:NAD(P)-dependent alcohol dehydrogenase [Candidatus Eremiobacteraeota bacterium]